MSDFDAMLWRPIKPGKEFDSLIPKSKCQTTYLGDGQTDFSINKMEQLVLDHATQTEKLAIVLKKPQLNSTTLTVHEFLYNHFQYKADNSDQMLRSPACSWYTRKEGIDCKSYSIFASCLLLNMGITHYIRKIKQPGYAPDEFTHVYVIVPIDQTNGTLKKGYYTIDGTIPNMIEPAFIGTSDLKMSGNRHYGLNGVNRNQPHGLGLSVGKFKLSDLSSIKSFMSSISCMFPTTYDKGTITKIHNSMDTYFNNLIAKINQAVVNDNDAEFSKAVNEFFAITDLGLRASQKKLTEGWNACSSGGIQGVIKAWDFYKTNVGNALQAWIADGFVAATNGTPNTFSFNSTNLYKTYGMGATTVNMTVSRQGINYQPKGTPIKKFEITPYVASSNSNSFNAISFMQSLGTVIATFVPDDQNDNPNQGGSYVQDINPDGTPKVSTMSTGTIVGGLIVAGGLYYAFNQAKDTK